MSWSDATTFEVNQNARGYYYVDLGVGRNPRLFVNRKLVALEADGKPILNFPLWNSVLTQTQKGTWVLRPQQGYLTFHLALDGSYRGESRFLTEGVIELPILRYYYLRSPRGALGTYERIIFSVPTERLPVRIPWRRSGRYFHRHQRYGFCELAGDGQVHWIEGVELAEAETVESLLS